MKALYYDGTAAVYREDIPMPAAGPEESLIKILLAAVCSTDKEILKGYRPDFKGIMGHEFVGLVETSSDESLIGKRVVGEINEVCGHCLYCNSGRSHHCSNRKTPGLSRDGCFAEYMVLRTKNLHVVPDNLSTEVAVFTEPLAAAFEITKQVKIEKNEPVAVLGDGRLALCVANVLNLYGADVTVIGHHDEKLKLFSSFAKTCRTAQPEGYELVVDATGSPDGITQALGLVRKMGTVILKSTYAGNASLNMSLVPVNEITIIGSRCGPFEPALAALADRKIVLPDIEIYGLKDFKKAFVSSAFKSGFDLTL